MIINQFQLCDSFFKLVVLFAPHGVYKAETFSKGFRLFEYFQFLYAEIGAKQFYVFANVRSCMAATSLTFKDVGLVNRSILCCKDVGSAHLKNESDIDFAVSILTSLQFAKQKSFPTREAFFVKYLQYY